MSDYQPPSVEPDAPDEHMAQAQAPPIDAAQTGQHINIAFRAMTGAEYTFKLKRTTKLGKAMHAYCARQQQDKSTLRFLVDGLRINEEQTPQDLELEDGDMVEVHQEQIGGGGGDEEPVRNGDEVPTEPSAGPNVLNITFKHSSGFELTFKMKATTKLQKATATFADRMDRKRSTLRFLIDGELMSDNKSLQDLEIDEDCQVDVMEEQIGGGDVGA